MLSKILSLRRGHSTIINIKHYGKLMSAVHPTPHRINVNHVSVVPWRNYRCDAHMNELPVPCVPWEPWYSDKQSWYNKILVGGILWWLFSLGMLLYTDSIYLNWSPPKQPGPPSDMVEECDDSDT